MSTDGPQPTQGAPKPKKKKEGKSVGCFLGLFFCPLFSFSFFLDPPSWLSAAVAVLGGRGFPVPGFVGCGRGSRQCGSANIFELLADHLALARRKAQPHGSRM
jgi:hypothetical protein